MISVADALASVIETTPRLGTERVSLADALGRVAAEAVQSARAVPNAANSAMDGYALRHADAATEGARLNVVGVVPAGTVRTETVGPGTAVKIFTGSAVPPGADAVVKVEDTEEHGGVVTVRVAVPLGNNIRNAGEDIMPGQDVLARGAVVGPADVGVLASVGRATIVVYRKPRVTILSTGSELVEVDEPIGPGQVVNSNAYALAAAVRESGGEPVVLPIVRDDPSAVRAGLGQAMLGDVVLSSGGVSVGDFDFVKEALDEARVERLFWKVAQKPGKPLTFGRLGERLFFGLPGNPVSALVCFYVYVRPALRKLQGHTRLHLPVIDARLAVATRKAADLTEFVRVRLSEGPDGPIATPAASQSSGVLTGLGAGAALLVGPAPERQLAAGQRYPVILVDPEALARVAPPV